jgi:glycerophosphoryl diester phosphodiesterase
VRKRYWIPTALFLPALAAYLANASWLFGTPGRPQLVAHLGLGQQFDERGLSLYACKGQRMLPPTHGYLENTVASVGHAFDLGADIADINVQPTSDGEFVLFHDSTLECRTNGHGPIRAQPLAALKKLDIGYGYSADRGRTFPFRGKFVGAMPTLGEMLAAFPSRRFMLVPKSNDPDEADLLVAYLKRHRVATDRIQVMGGGKLIDRLRQIAPTLRAGSQELTKTCLTRYLATGWSGAIPAACRNTVVAVPANYRKLLWGWPNLFVARMARVHSVVLLSGDYALHSDKPGMNFIDTPAQLQTIPRDYAGQIFTTRIDVIGPAASTR